jgi:hypothetical protein
VVQRSSALQEHVCIRVTGIAADVQLLRFCGRALGLTLDWVFQLTFFAAYLVVDTERQLALVPEFGCCGSEQGHGSTFEAPAGKMSVFVQKVSQLYRKVCQGFGKC